MHVLKHTGGLSGLRAHYGADMKKWLLALIPAVAAGARGTMTLVPIDDLRKRLDFGFM